MPSLLYENNSDRCRFTSVNLGVKTLVFNKTKALSIYESTIENTLVSSFKEVLSQLDLAILSVESRDGRIFDAIRFFRSPNVLVPVLVISSSMNIVVC